MIRINLLDGKLPPAHNEPFPLELEVSTDEAFIAERDARRTPPVSGWKERRRQRRTHKLLARRRYRRFRRYKRKQCRKAWYAAQKQRVASCAKRIWGWLRRDSKKKSHKKPTSAPFLERMVRLGFVLRTNNNARAVAFLLLAALWFCGNVAMLVASFIFAPDGVTDPAERMYNFIKHGQRMTDLEMSSTFTQVLAWCWSILEVVHPWSWLAWIPFAIFSVVYLPVALREEFADAIESAREAISQRTTTDLPDQPSGQPNTSAPARVSGGMFGNFLKNRMRFAAEDLTWEMIQEGIQRGWRAMRGG